MNRAIYILPNLFTTAALGCGFSAILAAINGSFTHGAIMVFLAAIFDAFDGRVARLTKTESEFGVQYDSLSDLISFGVAPSILIYQWSLHFAKTLEYIPSKLGGIIAFLYATCAALRLARFNVQVGSVDKSVFIGMPSPAAAAVVVSFVWLGNRQGWSGESMIVYSLVITTLSALAMVSDFKFYSFKTFKLEARFPFKRTLIPVLIIALLMLYPSLVLFVSFVLYGIHAPIWYLWRLWRHYK